MVQMHKKFTDKQVKELIERYLAKKLGRKEDNGTFPLSSSLHPTYSIPWGLIWLLKS